MSMYPIRSDFRREGSHPAATDTSVHPLGVAGRTDGGSTTGVDRKAAATTSVDGLIG